MTKTKHSRTGGFSMIAVMILITFIAIVAAVAFPALNKMTEKARISKDVHHQSQILKMLKLFGMDNDGGYPTFDFDSGDDVRYTNSTDVFNHLMYEVDIQEESIFYVKGNPTKPSPPNGDGMLTKNENSYSYVAGQTDSMSGRSPLIADEMDEPGVYGANHPWLRQGQAVVGFLGGEVKIMELTGIYPGATVKGLPVHGIDDIFEMGIKDEEGRVSGGYLAVDPSNILNP
ncbi:MAG: type II secretory pathway pseudopilin PulG [Verrucomicrobiales bacterium]|jgi:type II secretory pathway pseudopilin PulG